MLSLFSVVSLALFAQTITSLPALPSFDDAGLSAEFDQESNQFSSDGIDLGPSFPSMDTPSSDNAEALLSQQLALNVDSSASAPPPPASQENALSPGCDESSKGKRETGGVERSCPAGFTNSGPGAATTPQAPKKSPDGQKNTAPNGQVITTPKKPGRQGDLRLTPEEEPLQNPFGQKEQDPQCPGRYKYSVCGIKDNSYFTWETLYSLYDADLVINSGFGHGQIIRPDWANRGGIQGWTDALQDCGPIPKAIYCCNVYFPQARQALYCDTLEHAKSVEKCWGQVRGLPTQTVLTCIDNLPN